MRETRTDLIEDEFDAVSDFDASIVGGDAAGLSAALMLGRVLRRVVAIDGGAPRNAPASHMHGFLGHDGRPPRELLERGRAEIASYGVTIMDGDVVNATDDGSRDSTFFLLTLKDGRRVRSRRLLFAGGARDVLPDIPGLWDIWGEDVHICPYCHGYEVRDRPLAVIANGSHTIPYTLMIRN